MPCIVQNTILSYSCSTQFHVCIQQPNVNHQQKRQPLSSRHNLIYKLEKTQRSPYCEVALNRLTWRMNSTLETLNLVVYRFGTFLHSCCVLGYLLVYSLVTLNLVIYRLGIFFMLPLCARL